MENCIFLWGFLLRHGTQCRLPTNSGGKSQMRSLLSAFAGNVESSPGTGPSPGRV